MTISQAILAVVEQEAAGTRKMLERLPAGHFDFKPHAKCGTLAWLAGHVIGLYDWGAVVCSANELDMATYARPAELTTAEQAVALFDSFYARFRSALSALRDQQLSEPWTLRAGPNVIFTLPRQQVLFIVVMNHMIHHRGQLSMYLRQLDVPIPGLYGPSADEK